MLSKSFVSAKLPVPLMEDMHALPVSVMFMPFVMNCAKIQTFYHTPCFQCSSIMLVSLQLLIDKKISAHSTTYDRCFQVMDRDVEDNIDGSHKAWDSVPSRTDKVNKHRECIKELTLSQCVV